MRMATIMLSAALLTFSGAARGETADEGKVTFEATFDLMMSQGIEPETSTGTYSVKVVETEGRVTIHDTMAMKGREGRAMGYVAQVTYDVTDESPRPIEAQATTNIGGEPCMTGTVKVAADKVTYSGVGIRDRQGEPIDPPQEFAGEFAEKEKLDGKPLVFQSATAIIGARLLKAPGKMEVLVAEFPDDIDAPELVTIKDGHTLVRSEAREDGTFEIHMMRDGREKPLVQFRMSADGQQVLEARSGPMTMRRRGPATG